MAFELYGYQQDLVDRVLVEMGGGKRPLAVSPTGSGKSICIAELVRIALVSGEPVTVLCHRREILQGLTKAIEGHTGNIAAICSADASADWKAPVVAAMVPTLARRSLPHGRGGLVILDEGHHGTAKSFEAAIHALEPAQFCGFTATALSANQRPLSVIYDRLVLGPEPRELIEQQRLAPFRLMVAKQMIRTEGVKLRGGDFRAGDLEARAIEVLGDVVPALRQHNPGIRPTLTACPTVAIAKQVAEIYQAAGISAESVDGTMSATRRDDVFHRFRNGSLQVITFASLIDEGLDIPAAECLQFLRPTKSIRLRRQLEGRVLRYVAGKTATIIDHTDSWQYLPLPDEAVTWDLGARGESGARVKRSPDVFLAKGKGGQVKLKPLSDVEWIEVNRQPEHAPGPWLAQLRLQAAISVHGWAPSGWRPRGAINRIAGDPCCRLRDFRQLGVMLGFKLWWAENRHREALQLRSEAAPEGFRHRWEEMVSNALEGAIEAGELNPQARGRLDWLSTATQDGAQLVSLWAEVGPGSPARDQLAADRIRAALLPRLPAGTELELVGLPGAALPQQELQKKPLGASQTTRQRQRAEQLKVQHEERYRELAEWLGAGIAAAA